MSKIGKEMEEKSAVLMTRPSLKCSRQRQQCKHTAHNRPSGKLVTRIFSRVRVVQVGKCSPRWRLVDPLGNQGDEHGLCVRLSYCSSKHFPVSLGQCTARVENNSVFIGFGLVEIALHIINGLGDEVQPKSLVRVNIVE